MTQVKFCENNFSHETEKLIDKIQSKYDEVSVEIEPCLGLCEECDVGPFALVDDEIVQGDTPEDLFEEIKLMLGEE